jgi:1-acyl-sn-glycerol-3-phosphate acyltransferase
LLYRLAWLIFYLITRVIVGLLGGLRVSGRGNVPRNCGIIVAPNHLSFSDPPIVEATIQRGCWFMATDELFEKPIIGPVARLMRGFPVRQDSPDRAALRKTEELLREGSCVVVFPEGHVSKDGKLQPILPGTVLVALRTGAPILPVGLINTDKLMPPHTFSLRRSTSPIEVRIGKPISAEELAGGKRGRPALDHGAMLLRKALLELTGERDEGDRGSEAVPTRDGAVGQAEAPTHLHAASLAEYSRG